MMFDIESLDDLKTYIQGDSGLSVCGCDIKQANNSLKRMVETGGLLVLLSDNSASSVLVYLLCVANDVPIMLLDSNSDTESVSEILEAYAPSYLAGANVDGEFKILDFGIKKLSQSSRGEVKPHENLALLLSTSGSTGSKKFVRISKQALSANTQSILAYLPIQEDDVAITSLPMSYTYGLSVINTHFKSGAKIIATKQGILQRDFWDAFNREGVTSLAGVPYSYEIMIKSGLLRKDYSCLRYLTQAGGRLDTSLKEKLVNYCSQKEIDLYVMYGQTEATSRMSFVPPHMLQKKMESIGIPIQGGRFEIEARSAEEDGVELPPGAAPKYGEIIYFGENVSMGYAENKEDISLGDVNNGRLRTGDLGYVDNDGFWYVVGRKNRFAKLFGVRISLAEVEKIAKTNAGVEDAVAIEKDGKIQLKFVGHADADDLRKALAKALRVHSSGIASQSSEALARTESGKLIYK